MKSVRLAVLGCGHMAGLHAPSIRERPELEVVAACDVNVEIVDRWIDEHLPGKSPRPGSFDDPAMMYRQARPDAVLIATPHTAHFEQGIQALESGCHVLMEKPMVTSAAQAHALAQKVRKTGKIFVVGYNTPCTPMFHWVRQAIRTRKFGKLEMVSGYLAQNWLCYTNGTWRQKPDLSGGGQAYDSGAHLLNSLCWCVESNVADLFAFVDNHGLSVDVNSCIAARFDNGVMASIIINGNCPVDHGALSFFFENGKIDVDGWYAKWIRCWHGQHEVQPEYSAAATSPVHNFVDAILGRDEPRTSAENGIIQSELMDAVYESARTGMSAHPKRQGD